MPATKQELHYSERLLIRKALALYARHLMTVDESSEEIKISDELQQQFKDANEITLMFDD